jgi:hypothetical protein
VDYFQPLIFQHVINGMSLFAFFGTFILKIKLFRQRLASGNSMTYLKTMSDRTLGYLILLFFLFVIFVAMSFVVRPILFPGETRVISFKEVGNLRVEDGIKVRGIMMGNIKNIVHFSDTATAHTARSGNRVFVTIRCQKPLEIHSNYSVINVDQGIMGDRILQIDCGNPAAPLIGAKDTLNGIFYPGVSEALGYAWQLRDIVDTLVAMSGQLISGSKTGKSFVKQVRGALSTTDSLCGVFVKVTKVIDANVANQIDSINTLVKDVSAFTNTVAIAAPGFLDSITVQMRSLSGLVSTLDTMAGTLRTFASNLEKPGNLLFGGDAEVAGKKLAELQNVVTAIRQRTLQFKIYLGFF